LCVEIEKVESLVQEKRETQVRTFISQITATDCGQRSSTPAAKENL